MTRRPRLTDAELAEAMQRQPVAADGAELPWWVTADDNAQNAPCAAETPQISTIGAKVDVDTQTGAEGRKMAQGDKGMTHQILTGDSLALLRTLPWLTACWRRRSRRL